MDESWRIIRPEVVPGGKARVLYGSNLACLGLNDAEARMVAEGLRREPLDDLILHNNCIGDSGVEAIADALGSASGARLRTLVLFWNAFGARGARALADAVAQHDHLQELVIGARNSIGDDGASAVAAMLRTNTSLRTLHIGCCGIGDAGAVAVGEALPFHPRLQRLLIFDNHFGPIGTDALRRGAEGSRSILRISVHADVLCSFWNVIENRNRWVLSEPDLDRRASWPARRAVVFAGSDPAPLVLASLDGLAFSLGNGAGPRAAEFRRALVLAAKRADSSSEWEHKKVDVSLAVVHNVFAMDDAAGQQLSRSCCVAVVLPPAELVHRTDLIELLCSPTGSVPLLLDGASPPPPSSVRARAVNWNPGAPRPAALLAPSEELAPLRWFFFAHELVRLETEGRRVVLPQHLAALGCDCGMAPEDVRECVLLYSRTTTAMAWTRPSNGDAVLLLQCCGWLGELLRVFAPGFELPLQRRLTNLGPRRARAAMHQLREGGYTALPADAVLCACRDYWLRTVQHPFETEDIESYLEVLVEIVDAGF